MYYNNVGYFKKKLKKIKDWSWPVKNLDHEKNV